MPLLGIIFKLYDSAAARLMKLFVAPESTNAAASTLLLHLIITSRSCFMGLIADPEALDNLKLLSTPHLSFLRMMERQLLS